MVKKCIHIIVLVIFFSIAFSNKCGWKKQRGETIYACCTDFEEKGNTCIACSKGYTSKIGQQCRPCDNNTYGERCAHDCSCSVYEKCDFVKGCVNISVQETSGVPDKSTIGTSLGKGAKEPPSTDVVVYYTISAMAAVFIICLCFVFNKCKRVTILAKRKKKTTILQSKNSQLHQSGQNVTKEECVYNIIDDGEMLNDEELQNMHLDVSSNFFDA